MNYSRLLASIVAMEFTCLLGSKAAPVINEIYFHHPQAGTQLNPTGPEDLTKEWIEIHNPDPTDEDLTGWTISGGSISYTFPNGWILPAGGYLIVASNTVAFQAAHPTATNVLGNWTGELGNIADTIELVNGSGSEVDHVHYDTEGDWAKHRKILTLDPLGYPYGWVWMSDADGGGKSMELVNPALKHNNGQNWNPSTTVGGTPGVANDSASINTAPLIEDVVHFPKVPTHTQLVTVQAQIFDEAGTAGLNVSVNYRLPVTGAVQPAWSSVAMHDDGLTGDDIANDSIFAATLPAQALGKLVEYYVEAKDATNHTRTWPAASDETGNHDANALYQVDEETTTSPAPLYRVIMTPNELADLDAEPVSSSNRTSQRFLCTFIAYSNEGFTERQRATTRIRGAGSRGRAPRSVRIDFLNAQPWQDNTAVNLNTQYTYLQFIGAQLAQSAGVVTADAKPVQVRFNAVNRMARNSVTGLTSGQSESEWARNYGLAVHVEPINRDFLKHHFPEDHAGNLYTKRSTASDEWNVAASAVAGRTFYPSEGWEKQNNTSAFDYTDLHSFVSTMTSNSASVTTNYLTNVGGVMDVDQWLYSIATAAIFASGETNLTNGRDDDYSMYRGLVAGKFKFILHDLDTILGMGDSDSITLADLNNAGAPERSTIYDTVEAGERGDVFDKLIPLFNQPLAVTAYHQHLKDLLEGPFSKSRFDALVDRSFANAGWTAGDVTTFTTTMKRFMDGDGATNPLGRRQQILNKISLPLAVTTGPTVVSGYPRVTTNVIPSLSGTYDSTTSSQVLINGVPAAIDVKTGTWTNNAPAQTIVAVGASWKYLDDGSDLGTAWSAKTFADGAWSAGASPLGYSPTNEDGATTIIGGATVGGASSHVTSYFRHHFNIANPAIYSGNLTFRVQRDDGVILYFNGVEVGRNNMTAAPAVIAFDEVATASASPEDAWITFTVPASSLLAGDNVIAAEVHQNGLASSDCRFSCEVLAGSAGNFIGTQTAMNPGINRVVLEEKNTTGEHVRFTNYDIWYDDGSVATKGGTAVTETWTTAGGPYLISSTLTIGNGVTVTIQPGTTVYTANGIGISITGTGRLVADGTEFQRIRFTRQPGGTALAGQITVGTSTNEQRFVWCDLEYYGGSAGIDVTSGILFFSHSTFTKTDVQYISFHNSSFIVEDSYFETYSKPSGWPPLSTDPNRTNYGRPEMLHGNNGIPTTGYAIFRRNLFGHTFGFNDVIDFTGGNHPNAVLQVIDNVFVAATDDHLDLDNTDTWISGNVFLNAHADAARSNLGDSSSSISGGLEGSNTEPSEWTIFGNLFYNVDHAVLAKGKDGAANTRACRHAFLNNTLYKVTGTSPYFNGTTNVSIGQDIAAFNFSDNGALLPPASGEAGALVEHNIIWDAPALVANYDATKHFVTMNHNLLPLAWSGSGTGNQVADGVLNWNRFAELDFAVIDREYDYQRIWKLSHEIFTPCAGSPALGTGPGGLDKGGLIANGVQVSGAPTSTTSATGATLTLGPQGTFDPIVGGATGYVYGYTAYRWSLDGGAQSAETPVATPIVLSGLSNGLHTVRVWGKNNSANANNLSMQVAPTVVTWTVDSSFIPSVVINEVLATNVTTLANGLAHPDCIELYNPSSSPVDIGGWAISDDATTPEKFIFPVGTSIPAGGYLVLYADAPDASPGIHLGFSLDGDGESVVLSKPNGLAWTTVDAVTFGLQLPDLSIGRVGSNLHWDLNTPTLNAPNVQKATDCPGHVVLNEWLANSEISYKEDQIELYNASALPANIGGFFLTDTPDVPLMYQFPPLTFVAAQGYAVLVADGSTGAQANHLPFKLDAFYDWLVMHDGSGNEVDRVAITNALADLPEGRKPDGSSVITTLVLPTFGLPNPADSTPTTTTTLVKSQTIVDFGSNFFFYDKSDNLQGATWNQLGFNPATATNWRNAVTPLGLETNYTGSIPGFTSTTVAALTPAFDHVSGQVTDYFRSAVFNLQNLASTTPGATYETFFKLTHEIDDGAVFYLDGTELPYRYGMPTGTVIYTTLSNNGTTEAALVGPVTLTGVPSTYTLGSTGHVFAAEVHQVSGSSDVVFNARLVAETYETLTTPGTVDPELQRMIDLMAYLRISEVHYAPANGNNFEFVELKNTSTTTTLNLLGVRFTSGITYTFGTLNLAPGAFVVVAKTPAAFIGVPNVVGPFDGRLDNAGEQLALTLPAPYTANIMCFTYASQWYPGAFGGGSSLQIMDPLGARASWNDKAAWSASLNLGGSPGGQTTVYNFATWQTALGVSGANADTEGDGLDHLVEYALALDPKVGDIEKALMSAGIDPAQTHLQGTFSLPATCPEDIKYLVQISDQLGSWITVATKVGNAGWTGTATVSTSAPAGARVTVTVTDPNVIGADQRDFLRLKIELIP